MSTTTTNYKLVKPALTDAPPDITVMNPNWDTIDSQLKTLNDSIANAPSLTVDSALSSTSTNPVQNKVVNTALSGKAPNSHASSATTYGIGTASNYGHVKLSDATNSASGASAGIAASPAAVKAAYDLANSAKSGLSDYLPKSGGALTGALTVVDNFNVNKTFDDVEYKTYVRPINYSIGSNGDYSTGLIHYKGTTNEAQLMFNKDGAMLRDNVNGKAYQLFGQHNVNTLATAIGACRIQTGSYTGNGTHGEANALSLTFNFAPKFVIIQKKGATSQYANGEDSLMLLTGVLTTTYSGVVADRWVKLSSDGKTLYWWHKKYSGDGETTAIRKQLNSNGDTYCWLAIG